jgi:hypothetical protein
MTMARPALILASIATLLSAGACDQPKPRDAPAASKPSPEAAGPVPAAPQWATSLVGRKFAEAFPKPPVKCEGNTDAVLQRYGGASPGTQVEGWGWDPRAKVAVARVVLVDLDGAIIGAGETGRARPDVTAARPDIASPTTGWTAVTTRTKGPVLAWGLLGDEGVCPLGRLDF